MPRPDRLVVVVGTATEVGKTWVSAEVLVHLRTRGLLVAARKPCQSFEPGARTDAEVLAAATGEPPDVVCPPHRSYPVPLAPPMAAAVLGEPGPRLADLLAELTWPPGVEVGLVETVGGVRSPLTDDADAVDLIGALQPDVVLLVADAGLGTINAVRLSVAPLAGHQVTVALNRFDPANDLHRRNLRWLVEQDALDVVVAVADVADRLVRG